MTHLVDTDIVIDILGDEAFSVGLFSRLSQTGVSMSIITYMEAYEGLSYSTRPEVLLSKLESFLGAVPIVPISQETARLCAGIRSTLRRQGKRVRPRSLDLLIAATAIEHDLTLVTRNQADYADIPGLLLFNDY